MSCRILENTKYTQFRRRIDRSCYMALVLLSQPTPWRYRYCFHPSVSTRQSACAQPGVERAVERIRPTRHVFPCAGHCFPTSCLAVGWLWIFLEGLTNHCAFCRFWHSVRGFCGYSMVAEKPSHNSFPHYQKPQYLRRCLVWSLYGGLAVHFYLLCKWSLIPVTNACTKSYTHHWKPSLAASYMVPSGKRCFCHQIRNWKPPSAHWIGHIRHNWRCLGLRDWVLHTTVISLLHHHTSWSRFVEYLERQFDCRLLVWIPNSVERRGRTGRPERDARDAGGRSCNRYGHGSIDS